MRSAFFVQSSGLKLVKMIANVTEICSSYSAAINQNPALRPKSNCHRSEALVMRIRSVFQGPTMGNASQLGLADTAVPIAAMILIVREARSVRNASTRNGDDAEQSVPRQVTVNRGIFATAGNATRTAN